MHIHILGICGTFMGGVAALAKAAGHRVSGADADVYPPMSTQLTRLGINIYDGYDVGGYIERLRATQIIQDKAQSAGNGMSFSRTATPYWIIRVAPFGRAVKRSSAALRLLARTRHYRRGAPGGQPLHDSLSPSI